MSCRFYSQDECTLASELAATRVLTTSGHCQFCSTQATPPCAINPVVVSLALAAVSHDSIRTRQLLQAHGELLQIQPQGPGTELKKLLSWWFEPNASCDCDTRAMQMNAWGVAGCRERSETIVDWLLSAASERGLPHGPLTRHVTRRLVKRAIHNAEQAAPQERTR